MRGLFFFVLLFNTAILFGQSPRSVSIVDFVKINNGKINETVFYYENNWKVYRDIALERGYIKSYKLLTTSADSSSSFDLILITEYSDSLQFKLREERFLEIIKENRPQGPILLNDLKPNEFRQNLFFKQTETLFSPDSIGCK